MRDLKVLPEAEELLESTAMEPYMNLAIAVTRGKDTGPAIEDAAALPLEKRYVWRVASALKWAFAMLRGSTSQGAAKHQLCRRSPKAANEAAL